MYQTATARTNGRDATDDGERTRHMETPWRFI
jgi:hypothetical protein